MGTPRLEHFVSDGFTFDVVDAGPLDGVPVVLLHGWPLRASCWKEVSAHLHERGYRTYAPDQRGYSPGARPKGRRAYRVSELVADALALMSAIDAGPVHVIGHDWGATVAWFLAAHHPDRVRTLTTLSVPPSAAFLRSMLTSRQGFISYYMGLFQVPVIPERAFTRNPMRTKKLLMDAGMTEDMVDEFQTDIVDYGALTGSLNWYRALWMVSPRYAGRKVTVPTTHIWGDADAAVTRRSTELAAPFVTGPYDLRVLEGVGHWIPEEAPADVAALFDEGTRPDR